MANGRPALARRSDSPKALDSSRYAGIIRTHVIPKWAKVKLGNVAHSDVQTWITELAKDNSPATVQKIHRVFSLILEIAVKDGRLARNVATGVNLPEFASPNTAT